MMSQLQCRLAAS